MYSVGTNTKFLVSANMYDLLCSSPVIIPIHQNTSIYSAISPCLQQVVVPFVPAAIFAPLCAIFLLIYNRLYASQTSSLALSSLVFSKLGLCILHCLISIFHIVHAFMLIDNQKVDYFKEIRVNATLNIFFSVCSLLSYALCIRAGIISNGLLHMCWCLKLLALIPEGVIVFHNIFTKPTYNLLDATNLIFFGYLLCSCLMFALLCRADRHSTTYERLGTKPESPESTSSSISSLLYWYASKMIWKGLKATVDFDELWALEKENQAEFLRDKFLTAGQNRSPESNTKMRIFIWRIMLCTWRPLLVSCLVVPFLVLFRFGLSIFLTMIVVSVENSYPLWCSVSALCCLFAMDLFNKTLYARRDVMSFISYLNVRLILIIAIFDKMLKLSPAAKSRYSAGEIVNLATTDVQRVRLCWFQLRDFIYCPLMMIVGLLGLFYMIGWNTCYGIIVLFLIMPINFYVSKRMAYYEQVQMKYKDARLKLVNDILSGMKVLKLYAWELSMQKMVSEVRRKETNTLKIIFILDGLITLSFQFGPVLATFVSFFGYTVIQGNPLRPEVAFVSLMFFIMLRFAIYQIPQLMTNCIKAFVSARRILNLLNEEEQKPSHIRRPIANGSLPKDAIVLSKCSFTWEDVKAESYNKHLQDITLSVKKGELIGIVGRVGSGKSSILSAILGEMDKIEDGGTCVVNATSIGYVPQQPWIQNKTLRGNILFEKHLDQVYYQKAIDACDLVEDLKLFAAGDLTEIGEKGINLSGGQKARVSLARAVYQQADLYILDDTLSAVDSHVAAHIFERVIGPNGLLKHTTRLFALNSLAFLKDCDRIVVMHEGKIHEIGTHAELIQKTEGPFADLMREYMEKQVERQKSHIVNGELENDSGLDSVLNELISVNDDMQRFAEKLSSSVDSYSPIKNCSMPCTTPSSTRRQTSRASRRDSQASDSNLYHLPNSPLIVPIDSISETMNTGRLIEDEEVAIGVVSRKVYLDYAKAFGVWMAAGFFVTMMGSSICEAMSNVWLAKWSSESQQITNGTSHHLSPTWNLVIYGLFGFGDCCFVGLSAVFLAKGAYQASIKFHENLIHSLFRSPMAFFDRTPLGRIINRLSSDIDRIDEGVPWSISFTFVLFASAFNSLIAIMIVIPGLIVVVVPILVISFFLMQFYNRCSVQFRRLTSKSLSTLCSFVQDAYLGADSIRTYNVVQKFGERACKIADYASESVLVEIIANRWIQVRMDILTDLAVFIFILTAILLGNAQLLSLGSLALVINSGVTFSGFLGEIARNWREVEVQVVGIERVQEYINNVPEAEWRKPAKPLSEQWPTTGKILFQEFCFRYRPDSDLVLRNLNFEVKGGEKVGIVGRTGAGKTSLTLALFRIVEPASGTIRIDDVDIGSIGLHDLRQALTIIPQDPVLFCGTLRSNLDPFDEYSDDMIYAAIEKAYLKEFVLAFENKLLHEISESGNNLSVGQRQLVCLARALLRVRTTKVLVLDEATAAIDPETDRLIQLSIRENFNSCTILTIAHRLNTVLDYDKILVMDAGKVAEYDTPNNLLANPHSLFTSLAEHAGLIESGDKLSLENNV